jgi:NADH-quinone oxidoreductase subunit I
MRPDDPKLKRLTPPKLTLLEKTYLPQVLGGLAVTGRHILGAALAGKTFTVQYPDEQTLRSPVYRGVHRLNKDENGRIKCVACMLCATACPAHCIDIVGTTAPDAWDDREKYPESFVIDELRCIYCGMCEEACPVDAIELTSLYDLTGLSREEMIFDKSKLLSVYDVTQSAEPRRSARPAADPSAKAEDYQTVAGALPGPARS